MITFKKLNFIFLFFLLSFIGVAQKIEIKGTVLSQKGEFLPQVAVFEKDTKNATVTDFDGKFTISVNSRKSILSFSYLGFLTQDILVSKKNIINVILVESSTSLDEIVIIGYGNVRKKDLTGSVSTLKAEQIKGIPASNAGELLQGRVAGLNVINPSDEPGSQATLRIRGSSTIKGNASPLIVIDGFPYPGGLDEINPADIESIEVLKDASASAIYGSQGANGVIIVTRKQGKANRMNIYLTSQTTTSSFNKDFENVWKNTLLMAELANEKAINGGGVVPYVGASGDEELQGGFYPSLEQIRSGDWPYYTDWTDYVYRKSSEIQNTNLGVYGGSDKIKYNVNLNHWSQEGSKIDNNYEKINLFSTFNIKLLNNLKFTLNTTYTNIKFRNNNFTNYTRNPLWPVYNSNNPAEGFYLVSDNDFFHPAYRRGKITDETKSEDFLVSGFLDWKITDQITFNSRANIKSGTNIKDYYLPSILSQVYDGIGSIENTTDSKRVFENYITYKNSFKNHNYTIMIGNSEQSTNDRRLFLEGRNFLSDVLGNENLSSASVENQFVDNFQFNTGLSSYYGRLNYSINSKYLLTLTGRFDGSSKFGKNSKWGFFPSGALAWNLLDEKFMQHFDKINQFKIRASYGVSGNDGIEAYSTQSRFGEDQFYNGSQWQSVIGPGVNSSLGGRLFQWRGIANDNLKWESTSQLNIGTDFEAFDSKLKVTFDYYYKNTTDLLRDQVLPLSSGFDFMLVNDGEIDNKGVDVTLEGILLKKQELSLSGTLTFNRNRNEIISIGSEANAGLITDFFENKFLDTGVSLENTFGSQTISVYALGKPLNVFYGYKQLGIIQNNDQAQNFPTYASVNQPGDPYYADLSGDGIITSDDRVIIGDPNPNFTGSLALNFKYKKFEISTLFNGAFGYDILDTRKFERVTEKPLRWTGENTTNSWPSLRGDRGTPLFSDWYLADGSFLRIQNVNLAYTFNFPDFGIKSFKAYLNATNLHTFTSFKGYDPEVGTNGIYYGFRPRVRRFTIGFNINF
ncbi:SusC/RagA family TonB-linked outer membrane protein [Polaribacter sp.]|uniref:SusC/RagA family TonB-linked outer membrane protein n=1 Tax=Polaribacter sp. TaxID=1920175 RepID=UPI003F6D3484